MSIKRVCLFFYIEQIYELYHNLEKTVIIQMSPPQRGLLCNTLPKTTTYSSSQHFVALCFFFPLLAPITI